MARTVAGGVIEPIVGGPDPVLVDTADTAQTELERLKPLVEELAAWSGVYERWRAHPLAVERPAAASLNPADHEVLDRLGGAEFGRLIAAGERLGAVSDAGESLAGAAGEIGTRVGNAWPGRDGEAAVRRWEALRAAAAEHSASAHTLGSRLGEAAVAARGDLRVAVHRVLDGSEGFEHMRDGTGAEPLDWLQEIDQLERKVDDPLVTERDRWSRVRAQLDDMTARYARVITLLRGSLDQAVSGVRQAWDQLELDLRRVDSNPYSRLVPPREAPVRPRGVSAQPLQAPASRREPFVAPAAGPPGSAGETPDGAPAAAEQSPSPQQSAPPGADPGAIRAALDPPVADPTTTVTSAIRADSGDRAPDGTDDGSSAGRPGGTGPALGDTEARHAERTGEVRIPQLPDGAATPDQPMVEPVAVERADPVHPTARAELNAVLAEVVGFIAAILAAFGVPAPPAASGTAADRPPYR